MKPIENIAIFYFSGTGNAKRIASWFSEFATIKNIPCKLLNIAKYDANPLSSFPDNTLILIVSPTHGFNFPKITLDFIRHLPKGSNRVVLINTRAGMKIGKFVTPGLTGIALMLSSWILKAKGYQIVGQIPFDMPSNWLSIHPALNEPTVKYLHEINYAKVKKHADKIFAGQSDFLAYRDLVQDILISPIALAYYYMGRFVLAKSFYASSDCNSCGLCVKQCPVKAIKMVNDHPYWTFKCESCMRCMNNCPKRAIETAHGLMLVISLFSSVIFNLLIQDILDIEIQSLLIRSIIWSFISIALIWILYHLQHLLLKHKFFSAIISSLSLTHYKFWGRYKSGV